MRKDDTLDYTKQAADYLRTEGKKLGADIGSGHAHMLVAAALGYGSRKAMLVDLTEPALDNQWLGQVAGDVEMIEEAIARMNDAPVHPSQAPSILSIIKDGLTPACDECGTHSSRSFPLGDVGPGDDTEWICPSCATEDTEYGHCRCCGDNVLYRADDLDEQGLCEEHRGEFDLTPEEEEDWDSYVENLTKDGD